VKGSENTNLYHKHLAEQSDAPAQRV